MLLAVALLAPPAASLDGFDQGEPLSHHYTVWLDQQKLPILAAFEELAHKLDRDRDKVLTVEELAATAKRLPGNLRVDLADYTLGLAHELTGTPSIYATGYPDAAQVEETLWQLADAHADRAKLILLGRTVEGRPVHALRVSKGDGVERPKLAVVAHQHAREWMSHQAALVTLRALLQDPANADLLEAFDFWFVPLANPDGYEYSRRHEPMWRKNRGPTSLAGARGVDLNRNFEADFRPASDQPDSTDDDWGASDRPHSAMYRGAHAGSEPETRFLQALLDLPDLVGVVDVHGFGCKIVLPDEVRTDEGLYRKAAQSMLEALGSEYEILRYRELYPISGHLAAYADQRGAVAITLEVGQSFQPHPTKIERVAGQAARGVLAFARAIRSERSFPAMR